MRSIENRTKKITPRSTRFFVSRGSVGKIISEKKRANKISETDIDTARKMTPITVRDSLRVGKRSVVVSHNSVVIFFIDFFYSILSE